MNLITLTVVTGLAVAHQPAPFACDPTALAPAERRSHFEQVGPRLRSLVRRARELPTGYAFEFARDAQTDRLLAQWAVEEAACCPFFDIELRLAPEGGPIELRLTGRAGTKAFVRQEYPAGWFHPAGEAGAASR